MLLLVDVLLNPKYVAFKLKDGNPEQLLIKTCKGLELLKVGILIRLIVKFAVGCCPDAIKILILLNNLMYVH
jgi:hypothetical protein